MFVEKDFRKLKALLVRRWELHSGLHEGKLRDWGTASDRVGKMQRVEREIREVDLDIGSLIEEMTEA